jgi:hypothetical protein
MGLRHDGQNTAHFGLGYHNRQFLGLLGTLNVAEITRFYAKDPFVEKDNHIERHVLGVRSYTC